MEKKSGGGRKGEKGRERSESIRSLDETWKRKKEEMERSEEGAEGIFRESKKMPRSPEIGKDKVEKEWGDLMEGIREEFR